MSNNNKRSVSTIKVLHGDWEHVIVIREVRFQVNSHNADKCHDKK